MRIAFSTIASPRFDVRDVAEAIASSGYDGVELYALRGRLLYPEALAAELPQLRGLPIVCINSFSVLADGELEQLLRALELAHELESPLVKVFGGEGDDRIRRAASTLELALPRAAELGLTIVVETHDGFSRGRDVAGLLAAVDSRRIGALWDIQNSIVAGEHIAETDGEIGDRVSHVHVKDAVCRGGDWTPVELGDGELPLAELVARLRVHSYRGYLSYDYEKHWHDELAEPATSLPRAAAILRNLIDSPTGVAVAG